MAEKYQVSNENEGRTELIKMKREHSNKRRAAVHNTS